MLKSCSKKYKFEYAHQLYTSYTKLCHETIHGHSGVVELVFERLDHSLNDDRMVIDFGEISAYVKKHIMEKYDHALFMSNKFDKDYLDVLKKYNKRLTVTPCNPTAEYFANCIFDEVNCILAIYNIPVKVIEVKFWETETGCAIYRP
jgi:6-pyruvoyltetrahydropterin/6-carboxytetrahydropterin synthase